MSNECIIILGANQFQRERALIGAEKATDAHVITVSHEAPFHNNKYPFFVIKSEETNPPRLLQDVCDFIKFTKMKLVGIIPLNDFVLNAGLGVAKHFNLPYNDAVSIENCRNKEKMKKFLELANLPIMRSHVFSSIEEATKLVKKLGYPVVIKPLNFGGSGGVKKVNCLDELKKAVIEAKDHITQHAVHYDSDPTHMVMEPYIKREREVSVEVINTPSFTQVIGITDKYLGEEPYFSEIGHMVPSTLYKENGNVEAIKTLAERACQALNIKYGMAHVEIKLSKDGLDPVIMEVGARTAGDGIMDLYEKATGKNIYQLHCNSYLGNLRNSSLPKKFLRTAAIAYLHPASGIIEDFDCKQLGEKDLLNISLLALRAAKGQVITTAKNWSTRYGFVEYIFWEDVPQDFNMIENTKRLADKIFLVK